MARRQLEADAKTFEATVAQLPWDMALVHFERLSKELGGQESQLALSQALGRGLQWERRGLRGAIDAI